MHGEGREKVLAYLRKRRDRWLSTADICVATAMSKTGVLHALQRLEKEGLVEQQRIPRQRKGVGPVYRVVWRIRQGGGEGGESRPV